MDAQQNNSNTKNINSQPEIQQWMFQKKVLMLYKNQTQSWMISILASAIIAYLSLGTEHQIAGISWWLMFTAVTLLRTWNTRQFCRLLDTKKQLDYHYWFKRFFAATLLAAFFWGAGGFIVGAHLKPLEQVYIFIVLIGVGAAAIPFLGVMKRVALSFQAVSTIPYMLYISIQLDDRGTILLFIFSFYSATIIAAIRRMDLNLTESMTLQFKNIQMVDSLSQSNQQLQNANEKLETLTLEDELTQLHNRRYFEIQLKAEWKRESRDKKTLSLMIIDIDYFKLYNDTYGHAEGDACLKSVAQILQSSIHRSTDIIARIGGEEFVVMLPRIDVDGTLILAKKMQQQLSVANLIHATSPINDNVTVSIGVASITPDKNTSALGLFKAADKALYKAKTKGRNQVIVGEMELTQ